MTWGRPNSELLCPRLAFKPDLEDVGHLLEAVGIFAEIALIVHLNNAVDLFTGQAGERADLVLAAWDVGRFDPGYLSEEGQCAYLVAVTGPNFPALPVPFAPERSDPGVANKRVLTIKRRGHLSSLVLRQALL